MPKFSSFNAFGSALNEVGQSHVPVWLGTVAPHAVGGTIATAFLKPGLHLPAGMAVNLNDKVITPFITFKVKANTAGTNTYVLTLDPVDASAYGYIPKVGDYLQLVGDSAFSSNGNATAITAVAPNATDPSLIDVTVNINATAGKSLVLNFASSKIAVPNGYLYNDVYMGDIEVNSTTVGEYTAAASGAVVDFHGEGILIDLTPCAGYAAAMKAAVPNVIQVLV